MAGIGFTLKKLMDKDDLMGLVQAHFHSTMVTAGPWLITIVAIGMISIYGSNTHTFRYFLDFHVILIYNFAFSLIFASPFSMVATRHLADAIFRKNVTGSVGMMTSSYVMLMIIQLPLVAWYYFGYVHLPLSLKLLAFSNYFLVGAIWMISAFLTALKDYRMITRAFAIGMVIGVIIAIWLKGDYRDAGMLLGFNIGVAVTFFILLAQVFSEYNYRVVEPFDVIKYFHRYWDVALGGLFYAIGIWIDKLVMCFTPEATTLQSKMVMYFEYGNAMFLAYLTIIPSMAVFILSVETDFFEKYHRFYNEILSHAPYKRILHNQKGIKESLFSGARNIIVLQGIICFIAIVLAHRVLELMGIRFIHIAMYRFGVLGAFFHVLMLFITILFNYFDSRRQAMWIQCLFMVTNGLFTLISMKAGLEFYGYGYFFSTLVTFLFASVMLLRYLDKLPFHAFVTTGRAIRRSL